MIHIGDCLKVMKTLDAESVDAIVTDPPYGLSFMGKEWDHGVPGESFWSEALRVAKPGTHLLAFGGTRTFHRLTVAIEDAGWEIRDCIMWVYGSGFPKSLDVSKAIDREAGAEREVISTQKLTGKARVLSGANYNGGYANEYRNSPKDYKETYDITTPATAAAQQWQGWGTALKPAWEPIIVARKPLTGTVAQNVQEYGTGAINVDGCRVGTDDVRSFAVRKPGVLRHGGSNHRPHHERNPADTIHGSPCGRWPANLIHDGSDEVVGLFPVTGPTGGSAARFFYCPKASKADRDSGLDGTCTVKYNIDSSIIKGLSCKDVSTALAESLQKVMSASTVTWLIGESGASIMGLCPSDSLSTIATEISRITESRILSLLPHWITSGFTADANCEMANGGNPAENAVMSNGYQPTITSASLESARGVSRVVSEMLLTISDAANWNQGRNIHSTVKPNDLMRYLCRLVTPPGGTVLDPFCGSGSTGKAAVMEGLDFIGIELNPEYAAIAEARIQAELDKTPLLNTVAT